MTRDAEDVAGRTPATRPGHQSPTMMRAGLDGSTV
jgi:hypothetical protein